MIYLDNAATTLLHKPPEVAEAVKTPFLPQEMHRGAHGVSLFRHALVFETRSKLAKLFGCPRAEMHIVCSPRTPPEALNITPHSTVCFRPVITSFRLIWNTILCSVHMICMMRGVSVILCPADRQAISAMRIWKRSFDRETKAVVCTHASNHDGTCSISPKSVQPYARTRCPSGYHSCHRMQARCQSTNSANIDVCSCFTGHRSTDGSARPAVYYRRSDRIRPGRADRRSRRHRHSLTTANSRRRIPPRLRHASIRTASPDCMPR